MDHTKAHEDTIKVVKLLTKKIGKQTNILNAKLNELPPEKREHYAKQQGELNRVLKVAESGDLKDLQKIVEKYANTSPK